MRSTNLYVALLVLFFLVSCTDSDKRQEERSISIMAYYVPEKEYNPDQLPLDQLTHIIFSFSRVIDGKMAFENEEAGEKLRQLAAQREKYPHLKVMIACGGWGADGFSDMSHTAENRQKFVRSVIAFNKKYELDGIDIDWEYPAIPAANTKARPEDKQNFTLLMKELREALDTMDREQTLTFASAGWKPYYKNIEIGEVMKHVDYMNVMTYDQIGATSPFTGHHTALGRIKEKDIKGTPAWNYVQERKEAMKMRGLSYEPRSAEKIVDFCIQEGVKPEQIVIGAAFYGRAWNGVPPKNNGLYQSNTGSHIGWSAYRQIRAEFETNENYKRHWDSIAKAPYLYSVKDSILISYDDSVSVRLKTEFAIKNKLGGIMFWELGNDVKEKNSLLKSIYTASIRK
ncbi:MAG: glycoside hydrolase family 18 protein [Bacteroidota bacterium]